MDTKYLKKNKFDYFDTFSGCFSRSAKSKNLKYLLYAFVVDDDVKYIGRTELALFTAVERIKMKNPTQLTNKRLGEEISKVGEGAVKVYVKKFSIRNKPDPKFLDNEKRNVLNGEKLSWQKRYA